MPLVNGNMTAEELDTYYFAYEKLYEFLSEGMDGYAAAALTRRAVKKRREEGFLRSVGVDV